MPNFQTVSGQKAWSDYSRQNTSERVDDRNRPESEVRLSGKMIEVRTGANVRRARGPWVNFKRFFTAIRYNLLGKTVGRLSDNQIQERKARHAEYKFDRKVNELVESLVNDPKLSIVDVSKKLNEIAEQGEIIKDNSPRNVTDIQNRFKQNFKESLVGIARTDPTALEKLESAFSPEGLLSDLSHDYSYLSTNVGRKDVIENQMLGVGILDSEDFTGEEVRVENPGPPLNQKQHDIVQDFISEMKSFSSVDKIRREAMATAVKELGGPKSGDFNDSITFDMKSTPKFVENMNKVIHNEMSFKQIDETQINTQFLLDSNRMDFYLPNKNNQLEIINPRSEESTGLDVQNEIQKNAVKGLSEFVDRLSIPSEKRDTAIENLSNLINQSVLNGLFDAQEPIVRDLKFGVSSSGYKTNKKLQIEASLLNDGLQLHFRQEKKTSILVRMNEKNEPVDTQEVDPERNTIILNANLRIGFDDLVNEETTNFEVLDASITLKLDFDG